MKIVRNGVEYELTYDEMYAAYKEQQREYDKDDIAMTLVDVFSDNDNPIKPKTNDPDGEAVAVAEELVDRYRNAINQNDCIVECEWLAITYLIEERYGV